ncbi:MAG: hypothetical protein ACN6OP_24960, partial [Pseudomonadales bacterium]
SSATRLDPQGAWWCVRQCAAVMAQARPTAKLLKGRAPCPETGQVVHALQASLPGCEVKAEESITCRAIDDLATMLERRGCALLQLEGKVHAADSSGVFWIWMVGTETQYGANSRRETALLVVGQHWPAPWSTGFGAKVFPHDDGRWKLCSVDGEVIQGRLTALITVKPMVAS